VIVVDCSAAVDALTGAPGIAELIDVLASEDLHAPALIDYEVVAATRSLVLRRQVSPKRAIDVLTDFDDLPIQRWPADAALRRRAFQLRDALSAYDAAYVALAEAMDCALVTRDARLARSSGHAAQIRAF